MEFWGRAQMVNERVDGLSTDVSGSPGAVGLSTQVLDAEQALRGVLAEVALVTKVSLQCPFFSDLNAGLTMMAEFCARSRKRLVLASMSIKDSYRDRRMTGRAAVLVDAALAMLEPSAPARDRVPHTGEQVAVGWARSAPNVCFLGSYLSGAG